MAKTKGSCSFIPIRLEELIGRFPPNHIVLVSRKQLEGKNAMLNAINAANLSVNTPLPVEIREPVKLIESKLIEFDKSVE